MPFPKTKRVVYKKNPLEEVICQLRFPTILKIDTDPPAEFQERIRDNFPKFIEKKDIKLNFSQEIKDQVQLPADIVEIFSSSSDKKTYDFMSTDDMWVITLTNHFLAITSRQYDRWEDFIRKFSPAIDALAEVYNPSYFSRLGLRYKDIIQKSALGLEDKEWSELLNPHIASILNSDELGKSVINTSHQTEIELEDNRSIVRIKHGFVEQKDTGEIAYLIDSDFFVEDTIDIGDAIDRLTFFNKRGTRLIQWAISDVVHNSMGPIIIS